ncbi:MAG: SufE family protein [Rickettsiales bacterium]|jgi:cysteine desulfuration protein SufE|nr:SufE family protein [Rickettsiales bacterium]
MANLQEITDNFDVAASAEDKFAYLIELGRLLPEFDREERDLVPGCASKVWMRAREEGGVYRFDFASDAAIVRGLLYVLRVMFDGKSGEQIRAMDTGETLGGMEFAAFLSAARQVGLKSILQSIRNMVQ